MNNIDCEHLTHEEMKFLREHQLLGTNEVVWSQADLLVAENVETGQKRVLGEHSKILVGQRKILKG